MRLQPDHHRCLQGRLRLQRVAVKAVAVEIVLAEGELYLRAQLELEEFHAERVVHAEFGRDVPRGVPLRGAGHAIVDLRQQHQFCTFALQQHGRLLDIVAALEIPGGHRQRERQDLAALRHRRLEPLQASEPGKRLGMVGFGARQPIQPIAFGLRRALEQCDLGGFDEVEGHGRALRMEVRGGHPVATPYVARVTIVPGRTAAGGSQLARRRPSR